MGFDNLTVRAAGAAALAAIAALLAGPLLIRFLARHAAEPNRSDSARLCELHRAKHATPSMGGVLILLAAALALVLLGDRHAAWMPALAVTVFGLAALGAVDDLIKIRGRSQGLSPRAKLAGQLLVSLVGALLLHQVQADAPGGPALSLPGTGVSFALGRWFVPLTVLLVVGFSNAVNLTDGLDGLAGGCSLATLFVLGLAAWVASLPGPPGAGTGELAVVAAATLGALAGFLVFNRHPARVFMGDTGSLPLGGLIGFLAAALHQPWLVLVAGGVFVVEAASVVIQVASYRLRGKRVFRCAPLHHHFQFLGWPETRVVAHFWAASVVLAGVAIAFTVVPELRSAGNGLHAAASVAGHRSTAPIPPRTASMDAPPGDHEVLR